MRRSVRVNMRSLTHPRYAPRVANMLHNQSDSIPSQLIVSLLLIKNRQAFLFLFFPVAGVLTIIQRKQSLKDAYLCQIVD